MQRVIFRTKPKKRKVKKNSSTPSLSIREQLEKKRRNRELFQKAFLSISLGLVFILVTSIPLILTTNLKIGLAIPVAITTLFFSYQYPRMALWAFLIYMPFSGTITYSIGAGNIAFQLAKDIFYFGALLALTKECITNRKPILVKQQLLPTLLLLVFFCFMTYLFVNISSEFLPYCDSLSEEEKFLRDASGAYILNPETGLVIFTPCKQGLISLQGLLGLKVLLGYIPLIFCAYYLIETKEQIIFLGRLLVVLAIICCLLGLYQYRLLASGACDGTRFMQEIEIYKPQLRARCFIGGALAFNPTFGAIRLPGTFVSPWHWSWFLIANAGISFTTTFSDPSKKWRLIGAAGMVLVLINAFICGQRIALLLVPVFFIVMSVLTGQIFKLKRFIPIALGVGISVFLLVSNNPELVQRRVDDFVTRWNAAPPYLFIINQYNWALQNFDGILGNGLGLATNSARVLGDIFLVETFHARIFYEIGPFGLIAFMIFLTHLVIVSFNSYRSIQDTVMRNYASSFWVFILIISYFPYWYPLDTDPVAVYYWFFIGVIFKAAVIDKQMRKQIQISEQSQNHKNRVRVRLKKS